jgi:hypothetical protein
MTYREWSGKEGSYERVGGHQRQTAELSLMEAFDHLAFLTNWVEEASLALQGSVIC